jgi:hypothetical protein
MLNSQSGFYNAHPERSCISSLFVVLWIIRSIIQPESSHISLILLTLKTTVEASHSCRKLSYSPCPVRRGIIDNWVIVVSRDQVNPLPLTLHGSHYSLAIQRLVE